MNEKINNHFKQVCIGCNNLIKQNIQIIPMVFFVFENGCTFKPFSTEMKDKLLKEIAQQDGLLGYIIVYPAKKITKEKEESNVICRVLYTPQEIFRDVVTICEGKILLSETTNIRDGCSDGFDLWGVR